MNAAFLGVWVLACASLLAACAGQEGRQGPEGMAQTDIKALLEAHTPRLMALPGVVGTAIAEDKGELCIKVLVTQDTRELRREIPSKLSGFPVVIQEVGEIRALDDP